MDEDGPAQQKVLSTRLADLIHNSPAVRDLAVEVGLVDRQWLEQPTSRAPVVAPPRDVLRRFFERAVERHPSALANLGLNAVQVLSWDGGLGRPTGRSATATVAFTDLEGFTRFTADHGDGAALALLEQHKLATAPIIRQWGGRIVKHLGDGAMLTFPTASGAIYAALEMLPATPRPLRLRAGVHSGELVVTVDDLIGNAVNLAARVTADAAGGEVLVTADALAAAGELPGIRVSRTRRRSYKGIAERVAVSRVERVAALETGGPVPAPVED